MEGGGGFQIFFSFRVGRKEFEEKYVWLYLLKTYH
jgi:hypothetical protein